jgi:hypothetical protein
VDWQRAILLFDTRRRPGHQVLIPVGISCPAGIGGHHDHVRALSKKLKEDGVLVTRPAAARREKQNISVAWRNAQPI